MISDKNDLSNIIGLSVTLSQFLGIVIKSDIEVQVIALSQNEMGSNAMSVLETGQLGVKYTQEGNHLKSKVRSLQKTNDI